VTLDSSTSPTLADMTGTVFAIGLAAGGISEAGSNFNVTGMVPGDTASVNDVSVQVTASPATLVTLGDQIVSDPANMAGALYVTVFEDGSTTPTATNVSLSTLATTPITLPGSSGNTWAAGESHTFVLVVGFGQCSFSASTTPTSCTNTAGNGFQQATASLNLVWSRN